MASVAVLDQYRDRLAKLPADAFIGSVVWFSITGSVVYKDGKRVTNPVRVTPEQLEQWFEELDLDKRLLPTRINKVDAFRRATSETKREYDVPHEVDWVATCPKCKTDYSFGSRPPTDLYECEQDGTPLHPTEHKTALEGVSAEMMIREVTYDDERVVRHMVKEIRDRRGQKLSYEPHIATFTFYRGNKRTRGTAQSGEKWKSKILPSVTGLDLEMAQSMVDEIKMRYDDSANYLHADALRAIIRNYIVELNAIACKPSGGVYFVHMSRQETVDALQKLVEKIGQGCTFHQLPLVDTLYQREMLTEAFQTEVEDDVRLLLKDIAALNEYAKKKTAGKIDPKKYAEMNSRYQTLVERSEEYTRVLGLAQGRAASSLEMALDGVMDLIDRLDTPKGGK